MPAVEGADEQVSTQKFRDAGKPSIVAMRASTGEDVNEEAIGVESIGVVRGAGGPKDVVRAARGSTETPDGAADDVAWGAWAAHGCVSRAWRPRKRKGLKYRGWHRVSEIFQEIKISRGDRSRLLSKGKSELIKDIVMGEDDAMAISY